MDHKRNNLYSRADNLKKNGWRQVDVEIVEPCVEQAVTLPGVITGEPAVTLPGQVEEPVECGYCITPGMSYTPDQKWTQVYEAEAGFHRGTVFPQLDLPFMGEGGKSR